MIRSSNLVREPCGGAKEEKRRTRRQHLAGKRQALRAREGDAAAAGGARARRFRGEPRARFLVTRQIASVCGKTRDAIAVCGAWRRVARRTLRAFVSLAEE